MPPCRRHALTLVLLITLACQARGVKRVTVDAALSYFGNYLLLMAGNDLLVLRDRADEETYEKWELGLPQDFHVTAALGTDDDSHFYFYGTDSGYDLDLNEGVYPFEYSESFRRFFGDGTPDAVAPRNGTVFLFKNCTVMSRQDGRKKSANAERLGLPCEPDAAWATEDRSQIVVLKGDQIWIWGGGKNVEGPVPFSSMYTVTSWELIPSDDDDED